jgi:hypothetical protein
MTDEMNAKKLLYIGLAAHSRTVFVGAAFIAPPPGQAEKLYMGQFLARRKQQFSTTEIHELSFGGYAALGIHSIARDCHRALEEY